MHEKILSLCVRGMVLFTAASFLASTTASAIDLDQGFSGPASSQAEFYNANKDKRMTVQVNFVGGVARPGVHHIPDNVNLLEAISLAGGMIPEADPGKVFIKRKRKDNKFETIHYDVDDIMKDADITYPELKNNDTVMIGARPRTTENVVMGLSIVGSIVAILTGYMIIANKRSL